MATAVVTRAMFRTWSVRFDAIWFTLSVRSRQAPDTPRIRACPPRRPSVPTSPATRVTSAENAERRSTMEFTTAPMRVNSPFMGRPSITSGIFWVRSPSATAEMTRATSFMGRTRSSTRLLTASTRVTHMPVTGPMSSRSVVRPSRPTARDTRTSSLLYRVVSSMNSLKALATSLACPERRVDRRTAAWPADAARRASSSSARRRSAGGPAAAPLAALPGRCPLSGAPAGRRGRGLGGSDGAHRDSAMVVPDSAAARASFMTPLSWYPSASPSPAVVPEPSRPAEGLGAGREAFCSERTVFFRPRLAAGGDG